MNIKLALFCRNGFNLCKTADNPFFKSKFVPLQTVVEELAPLLTEAGFSYIFTVNPELVTIHVIDVEEGKVIYESSFPILNPKNEQDIGKAISYAKRYLLKVAFNVIEVHEDKDGNEELIKTAEAIKNRATPKVLSPNPNLPTDNFMQKGTTNG